MPPPPTHQGQVILRAGQTSPTFFLIVSGEVRLLKGDVQRSLGKRSFAPPSRQHRALTSARGREIERRHARDTEALRRMGLRDEAVVTAVVEGTHNAGMTPSELSALAVDSEAMERMGSVAVKAREAGMSQAADRLAEAVAAAAAGGAGAKAGSVGGAPTDMTLRQEAATPSAVAKALLSPDCLATIGPGECFGEQ